MTSINRLNQVESVEDGDIIPIWDISSSRTRSTTVEQVKEHIVETLDIASEVVDVYRTFRSFSGFSVSSLPQPFTVVSTGLIGPPYNIMHVNLPSEGGEIRGTGFTANTDSTVTVNKNMFACVVSITYVATFPVNDNVVLGIGIGDPTAIPTSPGVQVGQNYVSRFRCARRGDGVNSEVTWDLYVSPVGKSTTDILVFGLLAGDKIFPVVWTQETDNSDLNIIEAIFTVEEISI